MANEPITHSNSGLTIRGDWRAFMRMIAVLFKLRVVSLLLMAALGGAFLGAAGWPGWGELLLVLGAGGMAASGAASLNQYLERHKDADMGRTLKRPLVNGDIPNPRWVLYAGTALVIVPVVITLTFNPPLAFFLLVGALIYVGIYTIWLKPRTLLNIVIGGAAGSAAVMSGGAAVGAWQDPAVIVLALLVFLWTPTHFWSLAILYRDDYVRADVPMLPAKVSVRQAAWWVLAHTLPTGFAAVALAVVPALSWIYFVPVALLTVDLLVRNGRLIRQPTPLRAKSLFLASNIYLTLILFFIFVDTLV
jgi:protoheme IX farnesyltransferase